MRWHRLADLPAISPGREPILHHQMRVWDNKAWLFTGSTRIWIFDLITEKWKSVLTEILGKKWPYFGKSVCEYALEIVDGKLYVFGGDDGKTSLGTNIFMQLDLATFWWTYLGGTSECVPTVRFPDLRRFPSSWVVPAQKRIYILYGNVGRQAASLGGHPQGSMNDYTNEDLWSYDVTEQTWRRERLRGNFPSPRTEMACAYHPTLGRTLVYGGYNASMTTSLADMDKAFYFAFFGETYLLDPETQIWQHVLTRGFPSYRAQSSFLVDEATGKTYLYGGALLSSSIGFLTGSVKYGSIALPQDTQTATLCRRSTWSSVRSATSGN